MYVIYFSGFSHRPEYHLFRLGESASLAVKQFAEQGATDILDKQKVQNVNGQITRDKGDDFVVLDGFHAPPIESGVGTSQASIFLDGNHTRVRILLSRVSSMVTGNPANPRKNPEKAGTGHGWFEILRLSGLLDRHQKLF